VGGPGFAPWGKVGEPLMADSMEKIQLPVKTALPSGRDAQDQMERKKSEGENHIGVGEKEKKVPNWTHRPKRAKVLSRRGGKKRR